MKLFTCLVQPIFDIFGLFDVVRSGPRSSRQPRRDGNLRVVTQLDASTNTLIPPAPSTPQISIRTPTETDSLLQGVDRSLTPSGLSPVRSPGRNSPPWSGRNSGGSPRRLSRSRTSSNGSFERGSLKGQIRGARIKCLQRPHCYILPTSALEALITVASVGKDIAATGPDLDGVPIRETAEQVCRVAKKIYAILAYMRMGYEVHFLLKDGVSDCDLPLEWKRNEKEEFVLVRKSGLPIETFDNWNDDNFEDFERIQWWMMAPIFNDKEHYELDKNIILPFIPFPTDPKTQETKEGGYSEVFAVRCHPAHHTFWNNPQAEGDKQLIAIKKLYSSEEREFQKEVTILKALGSKQKTHPHLIKLLATYRQDGKYHLMFPYADANLRTYWSDRPSPTFDEATVLWSLKQMAGIASALNSVHNFSVTIPLSVDSPGNNRVRDDATLSVVKSEQLYGRHGDIKPENVLWFRQCPETDSKRGILQVADFGLGRFHGRDSRSKVPPDSVVGSPTYEPPECKLHRDVSRAYDIWSLGCLYLEFITWLLKGSAEIEGFSDFRGKSGGNAEGLNDDHFFTIIKISSVESDAVVREEVIKWVNQLHGHEKCSDLIHDLLDLVMTDVLLTDASKRIEARWLFHRLKRFLYKAKNDKDYLLRPVLRRQKAGVEGRSNSTSTVFDADAKHTDSKKVAFAQQDKPLPLTPAHYRIPRASAQCGPPTPSLSRSKTHSTWPTAGPSTG